MMQYYFIENTRSYWHRQTDTITL